MEPYKKFPMFQDASGGLSLEEFADAREVVADLSQEYEAAERPDYVSAGSVCVCVCVWVYCTSVPVSLCHNVCVALCSSL